MKLFKMATCFFKRTTKSFVVIAIFLVTGSTVHAQKGKNGIGLFAEVGFPSGDTDAGMGGFVKGMYAISKNGQVTLQIGVSKFESNDPEFTYQGRFADLDKTNIRLIPVLLGYKYNLSNFYVEPQVGFGELGGRMDIGGDWSRPSLGALYWAVGAGFQFHGVDVGVRYQSAYAPGNPDSGIWREKQFSFVGVHLGYVFSLK